LLGLVIAYVGLLLTLFEVVFEPWLLRRDYRIQIALFGVLISGSVAFTVAYVPVPYSPVFTVMDWGPGFVDANGMVGNVVWKPEYHELRIQIQNPSDMDYTDVTVWVRTDLFIAHVAWMGGGGCVDGTVQRSLQFGPTVVRGPGGTAQQTNAEGPTNVEVPGVLPGVPGYSVRSFGSYSPVWDIHCPTLRRHDYVDVALAVVNLENKSFDVLPPKVPQWVRAYFKYDTVWRRHVGPQIERPVIPLTDFPGIRP